ncbi:interferon-inducible GTPase 5-like [Maylandia zebra]|uniref:interferon-inducible GTPase 5-like n=1 Tax=Maylandia zebra TaxID=106582 RepID=UPI00403D003A
MGATGLRDLGIESPQVFLVSSFELHLYDFPLLHETLERELPEHQRDVLLFGICNIIKKKKEVFQAEIILYATLSAAVRTAPLGISALVDSTLKAAVTGYVAGFGLDSPSLKRLAAITGVSYTDLCAVINSPLATNTITTDLILNELTTLPSTAKIMRADNVCRFIPLFGSLLTAGFSFTITSRALQFFLSELADDAERVFRRALSLTTSSECVRPVTLEPELQVAGALELRVAGALELRVAGALELRVAGVLELRGPEKQVTLELRGPELQVTLELRGPELKVALEALETELKVALGTEKRETLVTEQSVAAGQLTEQSVAAGQGIRCSHNHPPHRTQPLNEQSYSPKTEKSPHSPQPAN